MALIFVLMLSLVGALFESASVQIQKNNLRARTMLAVESVFAEYDRGLLEEYDIFARFGKEEESFAERLRYYGASGAEHIIEKIQLLSDNSGKSFYEQAIKYAKSDMGMEDFSYGEKYTLEEVDMMKKKETITHQNLNNLLNQEGMTLPLENNPILIIENLKAMDLLTVLLSEDLELSNRNIRVQTLPSRRTLEQGNYRDAEMEEIGDKAFFVYYLAEHFSNKENTKEERSLLYEIEYLLEGESSDRENLTAVCQKMILIRMVANYAYLLSDVEKQNEAGIVAGFLCTATSVPEISEAVKQAILFAWSYGESVVDVRGLLRGNKIPIVKSSSTWCLSLSQLMQVATGQIVGGVSSKESGMSYQDYLVALLLLEEQESLCLRGLDLIETNLDLRVDCCMTKVKIVSAAILRREIEERYTTRFEYK